MISRDRMQFILGVILGEEGVKEILADLLEEEGNKAMAQTARELPSTGELDRRLSFVLSILPYRMTLRLGCEFLAAASVRSGVALSIIPRLKEVWDWIGYIEAFPESLDHRIDFDLVKGIRHIPAPRYDSHRFHIAKRCLEALECAIEWTEKTLDAESEFDLVAQRKTAREVATHVCRSRSMIAGYVTGISGHGTPTQWAARDKWWVYTKQSELDYIPNMIEMNHWQLQHVQRSVTQILSQNHSK